MNYHDFLFCSEITKIFCPVELSSAIENIEEQEYITKVSD